MKNIYVSALVLILSACGAKPLEQPDLMQEQVSKIINEFVVKTTQHAAFDRLEKLGPEATPYIIGHLNDLRALPDKSISLTNHASDAFEGLRHYAPETVHDALSAILNQLTGQFFEDVHSGATAEVRSRNLVAWQTWCVTTYPSKTKVCRAGT